MKLNFSGVNKNKFLNFRPVFFATVCFIIGIALAAILLENDVAFFISLVFVLVIGVLFYIFNKNLLLILFFVLLAGFGVFFLSSTITHVEETADDINIEGRVVDISPGRRNYEFTYIFDDVYFGSGLPDPDSSRNVVVFSNDAFEIGDIVQIQGYVEAFNYDPFDSYSMSYYYSKINYRMEGRQGIVVSSENYKGFDSLRASIRNGYIKYMNPASAKIAASLMLGERSVIDSSTSVDLNATALSRLFASSGLHIAFIALCIFSLLRLFKINRRLSLSVTMFLLLLFGAITGFPVVMLRTLFFIAIVLIGDFLKRRFDPLSTLSLTVLLSLLIQPLSIFETGFQLYAAAMLGVVCFYPRLKLFLNRGKSKFSDFLSTSASLSISSNTIMGAVLINSFTAFGIYFMISSIVVIPFVSILFVILILTTLLFLVMPFMSFLFVPVSYILLGLGWISSFISNLSFAQYYPNDLNIFAMLYIVTMFLLTRFVLIKKRYKFRALLAIITATILIAVL
ncbi:MAG: ComEC/Rec2 family competence protein [Christensenellaceae bacterium]|nr:ComEC/Rec2 family competence protein [Christensenellaceae bacterium]